MSDRAVYWQGVMEGWRRSGLSQAGFCRKRGLSYATFGYWKRRLSWDGVPACPSEDRDPSARRLPVQVGTVNNAATFVEVELTPDSLTSQPIESYEIILRCGRTLRVPARFEVEELTRLIGTVESC